MTAVKVSDCLQRVTASMLAQVHNGQWKKQLDRDRDRERRTIRTIWDYNIHIWKSCWNPYRKQHFHLLPTRVGVWSVWKVLHQFSICLCKDWQRLTLLQRIPLKDLPGWKTRKTSSSKSSEREQTRHNKNKLSVLHYNVSLCKIDRCTLLIHGWRLGEIVILMSNSD